MTDIAAAMNAIAHVDAELLDAIDADPENDKTSATADGKRHE